MTVIPDSIEPVEGWKVLAIHSTGDTMQFCSPSNVQFWPFMKPTIASCMRVLERWKWVVSHDEPPTPETEVEVLRSLPVRSIAGGGAIGYTSASAMIMTHSTSSPPLARHVGRGHVDYVPDRPRAHLVRGNWVLKRVPDEHPSPVEGCGCGIHLTTDVMEALRYGEGGLRALVRVKGWGKTIPGTSGARVEKAYPCAIYAIGVSVPDIAKNYGVTEYYETDSPESLLAHLTDPRSPLKRERVELQTDSGQILCPCGCGPVPPGAAPHVVHLPRNEKEAREMPTTLWQKFLKHMNS